MAIQAGKLNKRLTIEAPQDGTPNSVGEHVTTWRDVGTVWASVLPITAVERLRGAGVAAEVTHRVTLRHRPDLTARHRFRFKGRVLEISSLIDVAEAGVELQALCVEVVA